MLHLTHLLFLRKIRRTLPHCPWLQGPVPVLCGLHYLYLNLQIRLKKQLIMLRFHLTKIIIKAGDCVFLKSMRALQLSRDYPVYFGLHVVTQEEQCGVCWSNNGLFSCRASFHPKEKGRSSVYATWGPSSAQIRWKQKCIQWTCTNEPKWSCIINPEGESHALKRKWAWMLLDRPSSAVTRQGAAVRMWVEELASPRDNSEKEAETTSSSFSSPPPPLPPPPPHPLSTLHSHSGR